MPLPTPPTSPHSSNDARNLQPQTRDIIPGQVNNSQYQGHDNFQPQTRDPSTTVPLTVAQSRQQPKFMPVTNLKPQPLHRRSTIASVKNLLANGGMKQNRGISNNLPSGQHDYKIFGFYTSWDIRGKEKSDGPLLPQDIPAEKLTHLNYGWWLGDECGLMAVL